MDRRHPAQGGLVTDQVHEDLAVQPKVPTEPTAQVHAPTVQHAKTERKKASVRIAMLVKIAIRHS